MKIKNAKLFLFLAAVTTLTADELKNSSQQQRQRNDAYNSVQQQGGYMRQDGVYVPPARPADPVDLDKFLPRRRPDQP